MLSKISCARGAGFICAMLVGLSAGGLLGSGTALAQTEADSLFRRLDVNGDGVVTLSDLEALAERLVAETGPLADFVFVEVDKDRDGRVTHLELAAYFEDLAERRAVQIFARFDADKDGVISREERSAMNRVRFKQLDRDGDGRVTKEEIAAALSRWLIRRGQGTAREAATPRE